MISRTLALAALVSVFGTIRAASGAAIASPDTRPPIPIQFAAGTSSATVSGTTATNRMDTYSLVAEAGQTMSIELQNNHLLAPVEIRFSNGASTRFGATSLDWNGTIPSTGHIEIVVRGAATEFGLPVPYSMQISIPGTPVAHPASIEQVDFADGTVTVAWSTGRATYRMKGGKLADPTTDSGQLHLFEQKPLFGHVDGYAGEVAVVFVGGDDSGTGEIGAVDVFALRDGAPVLLDAITGGDRANRGFHAARIEGGRLVVESLAASAGSPMCCPDFIDSVRYRYSGGAFVADGRPSRRPYDSSKDR